MLVMSHNEVPIVTAEISGLVLDPDK